MNRKEAYAFVVGQIEAEGFHDVPSVLKALGMNPKSLIEKSMECRTDEELAQLAEETIRKIKAFQAGYFEGEHKRGLNTSEQENIERLVKLAKSGMPHQREIAEVELQAYTLRLIQQGVDPSFFKQK